MHCRQIFLLSEPPGKLFNQTKKKKKKKKKEILLFAIAWTKLEGIMPGEICQREKDKHYTISLNMCNLEKQIRKPHKLIEKRPDLCLPEKESRGWES